MRVSIAGPAALGLAAAVSITSCSLGPALLPAPAGLDVYTPAPASNPRTARKIALGRGLFSDRRLSADGTLACSSCHIPDRAFSQARSVAIGVNGRRGTRNAPALINRAWGQAFFWDGRTTTLEEQVLRPIEDPNELGSTAAAAARRVGLPVGELANALASYVRSIRSGDSAFDRYERGEANALTAEAREGLALFRGKGMCTRCHLGPTLTDELFHNTGVAWQPRAGEPDAGQFQDDGRFLVTRQEADRGAFKTPTLRDVERTAPYMHDGSLETLEAVLDFYDQGGRANPRIDSGLRPLNLTSSEKRAMLSFLKSLSGTIQK